MRVLAGDRNGAPDVRLAVVAKAPSGERHPSLLRIEEAKQQICDSGLPGAAGPHERNPLSRLEPQAHAVERRASLARVPRAHPLELDHERPGRSRKRSPRGRAPPRLVA